MEYINAVIGETEMFVPTNDKLGELLITANRRLNYHKYIAKMRKAYQGKIENRAIVMDSDFFYKRYIDDRIHQSYSYKQC